MSKTLEEIKDRLFSEWTHEELVSALELMSRHHAMVCDDLSKYIRLYGNSLKLLSANGITDYGFDIEGNVSKQDALA